MESNQKNTILITAYAINPYKGSEDGMGWNFVMQAAATQKVIAVTRKNNGPHIERYMAAHPEQQHLFDQVQFLYFDWPKWSIFWKKGPILSLIYYYGWQLTLALWLLIKKPTFDIAHNLNFHNDWTPSFLWLLGKPFVWGPVGHHPLIPKNFLLKQYGWKAYLQDRMLWALKCWFWYVDPFVYITKWKAKHVFCMNSEAAKKLRLKAGKFSIMPSVASEVIAMQPAQQKNGFQVISIGRFVPLKGFDVTIRAFAAFYHSLDAAQQQQAQLKLIGTGPFKQQMKEWIASEKIEHCTEIIEWMPKENLAALYQEAAVFLFPSHEGAGMVVAEAMSYGLPVVCFDNAGPGEFIHPHSQLSVPYNWYNNCVIDMASCLNRLFNDQHFYATESLLASQRFEETFLWNKRGATMANVYSRLHARHTAPFLKDSNLHIA